LLLVNGEKFFANASMQAHFQMIKRIVFKRMSIIVRGVFSVRGETALIALIIGKSFLNLIVNCGDELASVLSSGIHTSYKIKQLLSLSNFPCVSPFIQFCLCIIT
jgi:hypothetical protein